MIAILSTCTKVHARHLFYARLLHANGQNSRINLRVGNTICKIGQLLNIISNIVVIIEYICNNSYSYSLFMYSVKDYCVWLGGGGALGYFGFMLVLVWSYYYFVELQNIIHVWTNIIFNIHIILPMKSTYLNYFILPNVPKTYVQNIRHYIIVSGQLEYFLQEITRGAHVPKNKDCLFF